MRRLTVPFGILIAITGISTTIWSARYAPWVQPQPVAENAIVGRLREMKEGADRQAGRKPESTRVQQAARTLRLSPGPWLPRNRRFPRP